jgi:hypothetical protein
MPGSESTHLREDARFVALRANFAETVEWLLRRFQFEGLAPAAAAREVLARFERILKSACGPVFDDDGFIPPLLSCTEAEVTLWFGFTNKRQRLLDRVRNWIGLARAVKARRLLLDGSFVTAKEEPGDVDAVVLLPDDFREQLLAGNPKAVELHDMFRSREPKELFAAEDEEDWWGWYCFFSKTREMNRRCKGLIEVVL